MHASDPFAEGEGRDSRESLAATRAVLRTLWLPLLGLAAVLAIVILLSPAN